jgi:prepilin signal peptidase PulO-like enzyme (type II secretory pathway)
VSAADGWVAVVGAGLGFAVGWVSAWATEWVTPADEAGSIRGRNALVRDPLVQGGLALIWAALPLLVGGDDALRWLEGGVLAVPLVQVGITDLRTRYVYTWVAGAGLLMGLAVGWHFHQTAWWWGVVGAAGAGLAFAALYGIGRLVYRGRNVEPMASGDILIAAMVGAGAANLALYALWYGVVASGVLAVGVWIATRSRNTYMPFGPGLCVGGLITLLAWH